MLTAQPPCTTRKGTTKPDTSTRARRLSTRGELTSLHKRLTPNPARKHPLSPIQHEGAGDPGHTPGFGANLPPGHDPGYFYWVFSRKGYYYDEFDGNGVAARRKSV